MSAVTPAAPAVEAEQPHAAESRQQARQAGADHRPRYRHRRQNEALGAIAGVAPKRKECDLRVGVDVGPGDVEPGDRVVREAGAVVSED